MTAARTLFTAILLMMVLNTPSLAQKGPSQTGASCDASAEANWPEGITASGTVTGPCQAAEVALTLTNQNGEIIWQETYRSDQLFDFNWATNAVEMQASLDLWLGDYADTRTAGTLPDWLPGEEAPVGSEFPFYVDESVARDAYVAAREADRPMVCYIQGMESARCLIIAPDGASVETVGVQSFPG
ncbi:MAG: hypothetical protein ACE37E_07035 [Hyphomicrobiales bacterium]